MNSRTCDDCGLPIHICNAVAMVREAVKVCGEAPVFEAIGAPHVAEIMRLRSALFLVSGYLNGALAHAGLADTSFAEAALESAAEVLGDTSGLEAPAIPQNPQTGE